MYIQCFCTGLPTLSKTPRASLGKAATRSLGRKGPMSPTAPDIAPSTRRCSRKQEPLPVILKDRTTRELHYPTSKDFAFTAPQT